MRAYLILLLIPALAGCTVQAEHQIGGSFTPERTEADKADFQATVDPYVDGPVALMESFPEQFLIRGLSEKECATLRDALLQKDYLQSVGECRPVESVSDPDRPTSNP